MSSELNVVPLDSPSLSLEASAESLYLFPEVPPPESYSRSGTLVRRVEPLFPTPRRIHSTGRRS